MKILYYSLGAGAGHLVRAMAILRELKKDNELYVLTNSHYVNILDGHIATFNLPSGIDVSLIIKNIIKFLKPHILIVDTFYYGYYGELEELLQKKSMKKIFIFRKRIDEEFHPDLSFYDLVIIPNLMGDGMRSALEKEPKLTWTGYILCRNFNELKSEEEACNYLRISSGGKKIILVTHCGLAEESEWLFNITATAVRELKLKNIIVRFASLKSLKNISFIPYHISYFPVVELLKPVDTVISGCGYNTCLEVAMAGKKHILTPFKRKFDDQFTRARGEKYIFYDIATLKECIPSCIEDIKKIAEDQSIYQGATVAGECIKGL